MTTNGSAGHEPVEVILRVDDPDYGLQKDDHAYNLGRTLQAAADKAVDEWGDGPHWANVEFGIEFEKRNPGDIGAYKVVLSD